MPDKTDPVWWIEVIKVSPGLIAAVIAAAVIISYHKEVRGLLSRLTKFKGIGVEAEFAVEALDNAIAAHSVVVSETEKRGAMKRLQFIAGLVNGARLLWVDDNPASTRYERGILESFGARNTAVTTSAAAEKELKENVYVAVVTDLNREGNLTEGLAFANRLAAGGIDCPTIAYVGTDQKNHVRPANLFAITNRPDELVHYLCDVIERIRI